MLWIPDLFRRGSYDSIYELSRNTSSLVNDASHRLIACVPTSLTHRLKLVKPDVCVGTYLAVSSGQEGNGTCRSTLTFNVCGELTLGDDICYEISFTNPAAHRTENDGIDGGGHI